jgi:enamine deaminase RidA (YjgF/YER057c/UK114 family)
MENFLIYKAVSWDFSFFEKIRNDVSFKGIEKNIILMQINISSINSDDFIDKSVEVFSIISQIFINRNFLISIIPQSPANNQAILTEVIFLDNSISNFQKIKREINFLEILEITYLNNSYLYSCVNPIKYRQIKDLSFFDIFDFSCKIHCEIYKNQLIRTWNYIPQILSNNLNTPYEIQNYQLFNNIRYEIFNKYGVLQFPASTGIGSDCFNLLTNFISVEPKNFIVSKGLSNKQQRDAFSYSQQVLVGNNKKYPPLFERAYKVVTNYYEKFYISGTASILGENNVGLQNLSEQIQIIISNIKSLIYSVKIHKENIINSEIKYMKIYLKNNQYFNEAQELLEKEFPEILKVYTIADICRDDLLVEIECYLEKNLNK